jgi:cadmium resistance protein CadD (predicted permease)
MSDIPTGRTYLGFVLTWIVVLFLAFLFCFVLFSAGHWIAGLLTILSIAYGFVRHSSWIGKRAQRGVVRKSRRP